MTSGNKFATAISLGRDLDEAINDICTQIRDSNLEQIDLAIVFYSGYTADELDSHLHSLHGQLGASSLLGTSSHALIHHGTEHENEKGITIWCAQLPKSELLAMRLQFERNPDGGAITGWPKEVDEAWHDNSSLLMFGEPFSFPTDVLLERFNEDRPGIPISGGMAAGYFTPGDGRLLLNDQVYDSGCVLVRISNGVEMEAVVSQGCRPIGEPMVITECERNMITKLGGKPAVQQLLALFQTLPTRDQTEVNRGLLLGRVIDEYRDDFGYGDFLIRNVMQIDKETDSVVVGDYMRVGQTVQFHIRDHESASVELNLLLSKRRIEKPSSALIFSCNGRGLNMFPDPNHDAAAIQETMGNIPVGGYFAGGEIGPVAGKNFLHGFTASIVLFQ